MSCLHKNIPNTAFKVDLWNLCLYCRLYIFKLVWYILTVTALDMTPHIHSFWYKVSQLERPLQATLLGMSLTSTISMYLLISTRWAHCTSKQRSVLSSDIYFLPLRLPLSAHHVVSTERKRAQLNIMCWKIKEVTPCHAKSIQNAITVPWQQMKMCRPLWMGAPLVHSSSLLDWLAGKLHRAAMATDWSYAEWGCWLPRQHRGQVVGLPLSYRKLDWFWWVPILDCSRIFVMKCEKKTHKCVCVCVRGEKD